MKSKVYNAVWIGDSRFVNYGQTGKAALINPVEKIYKFVADGSDLGFFCLEKGLYFGPPDLQLP